MVCRGCCCGTKKKRPGVDHKGQLERLSGLEDHEGRQVPVRVSKCLGICFKANVVVVQPSAQGRAGGGRPVWLGEFTEDRLIDDLDDWIFEGGPGIAPVPESLEPHLTSKNAKKPKKSKLRKKAKAKKKAADADRAKRKDEARPGGKKDKKKKKAKKAKKSATAKKADKKAKK
ncbi:hypothetical protein CDO52_20380 [Nocardiopsis gilva YIM 90087]|uniref:(2Fe-2S) ferredoxin domain-containing protein n=1 Tax=Nocardiopsis gilva YIM 90087 TaxID=1235441 RepID=A0A223S9S9_9ACTN|nr:hypothetical protein CDO52_20380 [Nocardiopsis gilva YIM 90087]